ncbi:tyrosine-type recombinase/integrase [Planctomicrobium sp. SH661]|uniref:tyrosine-type recombinase/integrase n=1 Tax=Planctomicrobium sp. SH661 TaxID=3448124 RepID=UPI003F5B8FB2
MRRIRTPKYSFHKATGQARVYIDGQDHYLGPYDSPESKRKYRQLVDRWLRRQQARQFPEMTLSSLSLLYNDHCTTYYVKGGKPTTEITSVRAALKPLLKLFRSHMVGDFTPSKLRTVRDQMVKSGITRYTVNKHVGRMVRMIRWAVSMEYCGADVLAALQTVDGLKAGRSAAPDRVPVKPASLSDVVAIEKEVSSSVWGAIQFQLYTAARPGEALMIRGMDIDRTGDVWIYRPDSHKTEHHGKERTILIGPKGQAALMPFLQADTGLYLFPVRGSKGKRPYQRHSYTIAIRRACKRAGVPVWRPNQLRHTAATAIRQAADVETAKTVLGHSELRITEIYAERDMQAARAVVARIG